MEMKKISNFILWKEQHLVVLNFYLRIYLEEFLISLKYSFVCWLLTEAFSWAWSIIKSYSQCVCVCVEFLKTLSEMK